MPCSTPDCSIIIPTRNRPGVLRDTLDRLMRLPDGPFEVLIVDNASTEALPRLDDARCRLIRLADNRGAAARNVGALQALGRVLFMLDDDSWPEPGVIDAAVARLDERPDLGAIACRVRLADRPDRHDAGGVPGVFFNCGAAIRTRDFLRAGGYPEDYGYYVEEYALSCELWRLGRAVEPQGDLVVWHRRTAANRDNNRMVQYLVRNNVRLWRKYAPPALLAELTADTLDRYGRVARIENAHRGFEQGLRDIAGDSATPGAVPLTMHQFDSLFGLQNARRILRTWADKHGIRCAGVWSRGKGCEQIIRELLALGICIDAIYDDPRAIGEEIEWRGVALRPFDQLDHRANGIVIGSLSPGVAEDALSDLTRAGCRRPAVNLAPWRLDGPAEFAPEHSHLNVAQPALCG